MYMLYQDGRYTPLMVLLSKAARDRVLRVGDRDERRDLVRHEACGGHHRVLVGTGLGEGLRLLSSCVVDVAARLHDTLVQRVQDTVCAMSGSMA